MQGRPPSPRRCKLIEAMSTAVTLVFPGICVWLPCSASLPSSFFSSFCLDFIY